MMRDTHRDCSKEGGYNRDILYEKSIQREHVRFFGAKQDVVGKVLDNLGDE